MNSKTLPDQDSPSLFDQSAWPRTLHAARRWPPLYWLAGAFVLLGLHILCGTGGAYLALFMAFCLLTYLTVDTLGGVMTLPGFCVTYLALQHIVIYTVARLFLAQPADKVLLRPVETLEVYCTGMGSMLLAALVVRNYWPRHWKPLFASDLDPRRLLCLALVTTGISAGRSILIARGTAALAVNSAVLIPPLAIASSTAYWIVLSRGRRSFGLLNAIAMAVPFLAGLVSAGRSSMVLSPIMYYLTCYAFRFRFRGVHLIVLLAGIYAAQFILLPYGQYARNFVRTPDFDKNVARAAEILLDVALNPLKYQETQQQTHVIDAVKRFRFVPEHTSTLDRFSLVLSADSIVDATLLNGTTDVRTIQPAFDALLPRYLNPYREGVGTSNLLAHRVPGLVGKTDFSTQITLGFFSDAFSSFSWWGIATIPFLVLLGYCIIWKTLFDVRMWGNLVPLSLAFVAGGGFSEETIAVQINNIVEGFFILLGILYLLRALVNITRNFSAPRKSRSGTAGSQIERYSG